MADAVVNLPVALEVALAVAVDDDAPRVARLRALGGLERTREPHRRAVAERLLAALRHSPDLAARVHVALLVLCPDLKLLRDEDGAFVVAERGFGLDELPRLFGPADELPAFLLPPDKPAPAPYRSPQLLREEELAAVVAARRAEHEALQLRMRELGLDSDDLDDDADGSGGRDPTLVRRKFQPLREGIWVASFDVDDDRALAIGSGPALVPLGRIRAGAWWSESTAGDHKNARRLRLAVTKEAPDFTTRRERVIDVKPGGLRVKLGKAWVDVVSQSSSVGVWLDEDGGDVVGITLSWSTWVETQQVRAAPKPLQRVPRTRPKPRL